MSIQIYLVPYMQSPSGTQEGTWGKGGKPRGKYVTPACKMHTQMLHPGLMLVLYNGKERA